MDYKEKNFKHEHEDHKLYNSDILQMINLTQTMIKFYVNQYCIKVSD